MSEITNINQHNQNHIEEDEIDLKELFSTIWKNKFKIATFSFVVVFLTLIYVLKIPNSYTSSVILAPQGEQKGGGGLSSLASLAGISIGGGSSKDPGTMLETVLKDYSFNQEMVKKYNLAQKLENQENLVFALGFDGIYNLFNSKDEDAEDERTEEEKAFSTIKSLNGILSISSDKKTNMITLTAELNDRFLAKELVDIYLKELIYKIKSQDMIEIDKQIKYYNQELNSTYDVSLKEKLSTSLSGLMQKKVFSLANEYYIVSKIVDSRVSYIKEKTKPKRALILVVSMVTSIILGIFIIFFLEFIRKEPNE